MNLTPQQKRTIEQIVNVFETGSAEGNYADISIFHDGPGNRRQLTYGRSQTTEYGNLRELLARYVDAPGAAFAGVIRPYLAKVGHIPLVDDGCFRDVLEHAGENDPVMQQVQDAFFDDVYFQPAVRWSAARQLTLPLSMLVVYDSFIHSGGVLQSIRRRFPEVPPDRGGGEERWVRAYVQARHTWLATHPRLILHATTYRTWCFKREIARGNWMLNNLPIKVNGVTVR